MSARHGAATCKWSSLRERAMDHDVGCNPLHCSFQYYPSSVRLLISANPPIVFLLHRFGESLRSPWPWDMDVAKLKQQWLPALFSPTRASCPVISFLVITSLVALAWLRQTPPPPPLAALSGRPPPPRDSGGPPSSCASFYRPPGRQRKAAASIVEFGGVGDGVTSNTAAFRRAVADLSGEEGGAQLNVPAGQWLTGSFNLTSHFTLYLEAGAVILGSQVLIATSKIKLKVFLVSNL